MSKAKGTRIERKVIALLEASGHTAHRAPASLGAFDVFAWLPDGYVRAIQVKGGVAPYCSPAEREAMKLTALPQGATREIFYWRDYERAPRVVLL